MTKKEIKKYFSKFGLQFFWGTLIVFAIQTAALFIVEWVAPSIYENNDMYLLVTMLPMYFIAFPLAALLIKRIPSTSVPRHKMTAKELVQAFCISYAVIVLSNMAGLAITYGIGVLKGSPVQNIITDVVSETSLGVTILLMVIMAPVAEEFLFRKLLIDRLVIFGEGTAVFFSGLLFGLFHGNLNQFVYAFSLGIFLGFIYVKTGTLRYSIILHMGVNFMGSAAAQFSSDDSSILAGIYGTVILVLIAGGIILGIRNRKKFKCALGEVVIPKGHGFSTTVLNVGMILYILFWVVEMIIQAFFL